MNLYQIKYTISYPNGHVSASATQIHANSEVEAREKWESQKNRDGNCIITDIEEI